MTTDTQLKRPEYDPTSGVNRFLWVLMASQALRDRQPERIAAEVARINERARRHGDRQPDDPR